MRKHGLAPSLIAGMQQLGLTEAGISFCAQRFEQASFGQTSFSLSQFLSDPSLLPAQRSFASALTRFASRVPPTAPPPS